MSAADAVPPGLESSDSEIVFSRFGQMQPGDGRGLGLAIVKEIMELHGGAAKIESSAPGARISLAIPLAQQPVTEP